MSYYYLIKRASVKVVGIVPLITPAKNLLQDFDHIPRVQRLLEVIDKELGK
jgi:hypothetical protein